MCKIFCSPCDISAKDYVNLRSEGKFQFFLFFLFLVNQLHIVHTKHIVQTSVY